MAKKSKPGLAGFGGKIAGSKGKSLATKPAGFGGKVAGGKMGKGGKSKMLAKKAANC